MKVASAFTRKCPCLNRFEGGLGEVYGIGIFRLLDPPLKRVLGDNHDSVCPSRFVLGMVHFVWSRKSIDGEDPCLLLLGCRYLLRRSLCSAQVEHSLRFEGDPLVDEAVDDFDGALRGRRLDEILEVRVGGHGGGAGSGALVGIILC